MRYFFISILLLTFFQLSAQPTVLLKNGKSDFIIRYQSQNAEMQKNAALVFQYYFKKISDVELSIFTNEKIFAPQIEFILPESDSLSIKYDGFAITSGPTTISIYAISKLGFENAVYSFFEKYLSCNFYSDDCIVLPKKKDLIISKIDMYENPAFQFRTINAFQAYQPEYGKWNKLHNTPAIEGKRSGISNQFGRYWVHTFTKLVPPSEYFSSHPEYYAQRNGIRTTSQLCLANPEVLAIVIKNLQIEIDKNPTAKYWSVSQDDNYNFCQCDKCRAIDSIEGSHSGSIIRFVNEVAGHFPDKHISTLAYQYSRSAPKITKPLPNVNIMLCTIECDRSKPLTTDQTKGSFVSDLKDWAAISNNIMVWDYIVNFYNSLMPFPNFPVLAPNLQLFHQNNVTMVFEQGFTTKNTEMNDLRCYVLSKLLWNPYYSTDSLVDKFLTAYYGAAAPYIREYISLTEIELKKSAKGLSIYQPPFTNSTSFLRPDLMKRYFEILEKGKNAVKNDSLYALHVENVIQQVRYAWLEVSRDNVHSTNWLFEENENGFFVPKPENIGMLSALCNHARIYGPDQFDERRLSPDIYESKMNDYFQHGVSVNFKKIKDIKITIPNSSKYPADGPKTLVDGVKGVMNYNSLWLGWENSDMEAVLEMKTTTEIKKVTMNFMYFSESWILLPKKVRVSFSMDGVHFQDTVVWLDTTAAQKMEKQIFTCSLSLAKAVKANFVKVYVEKLGLMPAWTEVKGDAWFFIDEIDIE